MRRTDCGFLFGKKAAKLRLPLSVSAGEHLKEKPVLIAAESSLAQSTHSVLSHHMTLMEPHLQGVGSNVA